jgi:hypothetical protein
MIRFLATAIPAPKKQRIKGFRVGTGSPWSSVSRPAYREYNGREDTHSRSNIDRIGGKTVKSFCAKGSLYSG